MVKLISKSGSFKKNLLRILVFTIIASIVSLSSINIFASYQSGTNNGFYYSCWTNDKGTVNYQNQAGGRYTVSWDSKGASGFNFTCGKGWSNGDGNRAISYSGNFNPGNNGYLALYGWTKLPAGSTYKVAEYYVVESYGNWTPPGTSSDIVSLGTMTSDGGTYNLYRATRTNQPWVVDNGNGTFYQYWSVRTPKVPSGNNIKGTITFKNHIAAWQKAGLTVGDVSAYYQIMETEGYESTGNSDITVGTGTSAPVWQGIGGLDGAVWSTVADKSGRVYMGGEFSGYVAKYENNTLTKLPGLPCYTSSLALDSSGALYASAASQVYKLSGTTWTTVGSAFDRGISAIAFDSNGVLYAAGDFTGNVATYSSSKWTIVGSSLDYSANRLVAGDSSVMYVAGRFTDCVAEFKNGTYTKIGQGLFDATNDNIYALAYKNKTLYVGGAFSYSKYHNLAKYDAATKTWSSCHTGTAGYVYGLTVDSSNAVIVGGSLTQVGGGPDLGGLNVKGIAKFDGNNWIAMEAGLIEGDAQGRGGVPQVNVYSLAFDSNGVLYGGGWFKTSNGNNIAVYK